MGFFRYYLPFRNFFVFAGQAKNCAHFEHRNRIQKKHRALAVSAQENIRCRKTNFAQNPSFRRLAIRQYAFATAPRLCTKFVFYGASSFANVSLHKNLLHSMYGGDSLAFIQFSKSYWQNRMFSYVEPAFEHGVFFKYILETSRKQMISSISPWTR